MQKPSGFGIRAFQTAGFILTGSCGFSSSLHRCCRFQNHIFCAGILKSMPFQSHDADLPDPSWPHSKSRQPRGIEEFCDGLGAIAVSDSPLEIKRMQRLGCNEGPLEEFLLKFKYTETKKTTNKSLYKLQTLWICGVKQSLHFSGGGCFGKDRFQTLFQVVISKTLVGWLHAMQSC